MRPGFDTGELLERVGAEGHTVRPHDPIPLVDPDHRGHVADRVELGQHMIRVDEHRHRDAVRELAHVVGRVVERYRDDREPFVGELVVQRLPPGQVRAAASPGCERDEQLLPVVPLLERVQVAVEVGQLE